MIRRLSTHLVLMVAIVATIGCDRVTKHAAMTSLAGEPGRSYLIGAGLILAGGASNWIDRVMRGSVVDFINVGVGPLRTGIFNVADVAVMLGMAVMIVGERRRF